MTRPGPVLAAACAAVLLVSACTSDGPGPNYSTVPSTPETSSTTSPTTSSPSAGVPATGPNVKPGEVPPVEPASAAADSAAGALAFASFYLKSLDWAFATESSSFLEAFYAPNCTTCMNRLAYLRTLFNGGNHIEGGRLSIKEQAVVANDKRLGAVMAVSTAVSVTAVKVLAPSGATTSSDPGTGFISLTTWLVRDGANWQIVEERYA